MSQMSVFVLKWYYSRISVLSLVPIYGESGRMILINLVPSRRRLIFLHHSVRFYEIPRPGLSLPGSRAEAARSACRPHGAARLKSCGPPRHQRGEPAAPGHPPRPGSPPLSEAARLKALGQRGARHAESRSPEHTSPQHRVPVPGWENTCDSEALRIHIELLFVSCGCSETHLHVPSARDTASPCSQSFVSWA